MINKGLLILGVVCAVFILSTTPVYAYIDPGTGSMIVQVIAASVLTASAMLGVFWRSIKNFFLPRGKRRKNAAAGSNQIDKTDGSHNSHEG